MFSLIKKSADVFDIKVNENPFIPLLNFSFDRKKRFENDTGFGIYVLKLFNEIIYVGSYCGRKNGVASDRWWTHLASISSRFIEINFIKQEKPSFAQIKIKEPHLVEQFLNEKKIKFHKEYANVSNNKFFRQDVFDKILCITTEHSQNLSLVLGNGSCMTYPTRIAVVNKYWDDIRSFTKADLLNAYTFYYYKIPESGSRYSNLIRFLYSEEFDIKIRKNFFRNFIEDDLINKIKPQANKFKPVRETNINIEIIKDAEDIKDTILHDLN